MKVEQIYTGCLAQGAYYIESKGEAAIIDPLREISPYIEKAAQHQVKIRYVLETHFHADFVSGHVDLAKATGAEIVYGAQANPQFPARLAADGETLALGDLTIKVLHTPGHTPESVTYLLQDEQGRDFAIFTGDTLFIGDVGRPDLAAGAELSQEQLAGQLYDSLRNKIMPLADEVLVYPAHGAGSACGKNMSKETVDTLGHQKKTNYALRADMTKAEFIGEVTAGLQPPPGYFPLNVQLNKQGYTAIDSVLRQGLRALRPDAFEAVVSEGGVLILDTRAAASFAAGFIPHAINIGLDGSFAPWAGELIPDLRQPILFVADAGREEEVVTRLARVGFDRVLGYLQGGMEAWKAAGKEVETIVSIPAAAFAERYKKGLPMVVDVRKPHEYQAGHVAGARNMPLDFLNQHLSGIPMAEVVYAYCAGGYRSMMAVSILKARGYENVVDIAGGMKAIAETGVPCTEITHPATSRS